MACNLHLSGSSKYVNLWSVANVWRLAIISEDSNALSALSALDFIDLAGQFTPGDDPGEILADESLDALLVIIDGFDSVHERLPALSEKLPVLVFTDDDRAEHINLALRNGVSSYVVKGFEPTRQRRARLKLDVMGFEYAVTHPCACEVYERSQFCMWYQLYKISRGFLAGIFCTPL